jgi:CMP-N-acetylneuraminic acid synthetase
MKYSTVGIVCAKSNSNRFPNKNIHELDGAPMFWHSVQPLLESDRVDEVYVATDSKFIKEYCENRGVKIVWRKENAIHDQEPLLGVLRFAYKNIDKRYENIITIMANCPFHSVEAVDKAVDLIGDESLLEIRSFNSSGEESGLMVFKEEVILNNTQLSSHIGFVDSDVKEIHYKEDL